MIKSRRYPIKRPPLQIIVMADLLAVVLGLLAVYWLAAENLESVIVGFVIFLIPNIYFLWCAFRYMGAMQTRQVARSFVTGEVVKFGLTILLFAGSYKWLQLNSHMAMFTAYLALWLIHQLAAFAAVGADPKNLNFKIR